MGNASYHEECQSTPGSSKVAGYFSSHVDRWAPSGETITQASYSSYITTKPESFMHEPPSPRVKADTSDTTLLKGRELQSNWNVKGIADMMDVKFRRAEELGSVASIDFSSSGRITYFD